MPILHEMAIGEMMRSGERRDALDAADRELERRPDTVRTLLRKARVLTEEKQYDAAVATVRKALELEPGSVEALAELGLAHMYAERAHEALTCFEEVLCRDEPRNSSWRRRGASTRRTRR